MKHLKILIFILLTAITQIAAAQSYAVGDTTNEYTVKATVYANKFVGRKTSSGEVFRQELYTAAHWKIKLGTLVLITNPENGKQIIVKVNDRCPTKGVIDLTRQGFNSLGMKGVKKVVIRQLPDSYYSQWANQSSEFDLTLNPHLSSTTKTTNTEPANLQKRNIAAAETTEFAPPPLF